MIFYLDGILTHQFEDSVVLDVLGVGYQVFMPGIEIDALPETGTKLKLFTYHVVREDSQSLYGFATLDSRAFFIQLTSVSGVGPKMALKLLSTLSASAMTKAIVQEDLSVLTSVSGVGRKLAERLILDLKDKLPKMTQTDFGKTAATSSSTANMQMEQDLTSALKSLGYNAEEIKHAIRQSSHLLTPESTEQESLKVLLRHL